MYITACATFMHHVLLYICVCLFVDGMTPSVLRRSSGICSTTKSTTSTSVKFPISYQARTAAICVLHTHSHRLVHLACICCHRCVCVYVYTQEGCIHQLPDMVPVPVRLRKEDGRYVGEWCLCDRKIEVPAALDRFSKAKDTVALHHRHVMYTHVLSV